MAKDRTIAAYMVEHPYTVRAEDSASAAEKIMFAHRIRHLPVLDGKRVMGIVSDREIALARSVYGKRPFDGEVMVKDVCRFEPCTVDANESVNAVARRMSKEHLEAVAVLRGGELAGIFTSTDACRLLGDCFGKNNAARSGLFSRLFGK
jgi:acetoin utilization protein AcuB